MEAAMTATDVMKALNLKDRDSLYALVRSKRLPAVQLGRQYRFDPDAVREFLRGDPAPAETAERKRKAAPDWMKGVKRTIKR